MSYTDDMDEPTREKFERLDKRDQLIVQMVTHVGALSGAVAALTLKQDDHKRIVLDSTAELLDSLAAFLEEEYDPEETKTQLYESVGLEK